MLLSNRAAKNGEIEENFPALDSSGIPCPFRYLPVSQPPARGLHTITPMPYRCVTGKSSRSTVRTKMRNLSRELARIESDQR